MATKGSGSQRIEKAASRNLAMLSGDRLCSLQVRLPIRTGGSQGESVLARRRHSQPDRRPALHAVKDLEVQPLTQARIVNLRAPSPKLRRQGTSNLQVVKLKLDEPHLLGKIATNIARAYE